MANRKVVPGRQKKPNLHRRKRKQRNQKMMHFQQHFSCKLKVLLKERVKSLKRKQVAQICIKIQEKGLTICHKIQLLHANISQMLSKMRFMAGDGSVPSLVSSAHIDTCCHKVIKSFQRNKEQKRKLRLKQEEKQRMQKLSKNKLKKTEQLYRLMDSHLLLKNHLQHGKREGRKKNKQKPKKITSNNK